MTMKTRMKMKTKKKTTSGNRLVATACLCALLCAIPSLAGKKKNSPEKDLTEPHAVVAGTVFRSTGFALEAAEVTVAPESPSEDQSKIKKVKGLTDARGEFAVRVPPVPMRYVVHVKLNGYQDQEKTVSIEGEQRKEINFLLEPVIR
jgi:hypothetical protein